MDPNGSSGFRMGKVGKEGGGSSRDRTPLTPIALIAAAKRMVEDYGRLT